MQYSPVGVSARNPDGLAFLVVLGLGLGGVALMVWGARIIAFSDFRTWTPRANYIKWSGWRARFAGVAISAIGAVCLAVGALAFRYK